MRIQNQTKTICDLYCVIINKLQIKSKYQLYKSKIDIKNKFLYKLLTFSNTLF